MAIRILNPPPAAQGMDGILVRLVLAGAAVLAAAATGLAVAIHARRPPAAPQATPPEPFPAAAIPRLTETIGKIATAYGDRAPADVALVVTSLRRALAVMYPEAGPPQEDGTGVYLVALRGRFTGIASPPGIPLASGPHLWVVLERASFSVLAVAIRSQPPPEGLADLGTVVHLSLAHPVTDPAHP